MFYQEVREVIVLSTTYIHWGQMQTIQVFLLSLSVFFFWSQRAGEVCDMWEVVLVKYDKFTIRIIN